MASQFHFWRPVDDTCADCGMPKEVYQTGLSKLGPSPTWMEILESPYACLSGSTTKCCGWAGGYRYDYNFHKYLCRHCWAEVNPNEFTVSSPFTIGSNPKECTCGSKKTYGENATHSAWCDLNDRKK